jgi:signal transduction histidine kinase
MENDAPASPSPGLETQRLLDALEEGILQVEEGRVSAANGALARMLGLPTDELIGIALSELLTDPDGVPLAELASSDAVRLREASGALLPVSLRVVNERTLIVVDRSRERRLEQEVWRLAGPEAARSCLLEGPLASEVACMIEHEIGTASTVIRGYLRMLLEERPGALTSEQKSFLLEARRETDRIGSLVSNLLELAAADSAAGLSIALKTERLQPLVEIAVDGCRPLFDEHEMQVEVELDLDSDEVRIDPLRIEQVLINLLSNAAKFAPFGSTVRVAAHVVEFEDGARLSVSVIDEGPGVSVEEADQIFKPFVRGSSAESGTVSGVGLGLAVCHAIAGAHGGRVEAIPGLGYGHFRLLLPVEV